jgi:asparagine synthase (glutamine-hydrolysing)
MTVQFGRWNFEGQQAAPDYLGKVSSTLAPYGPDSNESYAQGGVSILYRAFHTTKESRRESQPHISPSGAVITWVGRLDNRSELIRDLRDGMTANPTDVDTVAAAYEKWGANCIPKLIGDWALSIWNPNDRSLLLAKDFIGTHHLYYLLDKDHVTWSTILDPLVLFAGGSFSICEEYIAGWFSYFPAAHLTPYVGIRAVPPSSSVLLRPGKQIIRKYWDFDPAKKIRYCTDAEYEEHFRSVFATAVQRRLRSDRPIFAELSGGMDSSSIVCVADTLIARGGADTPRLDTISWYDDSYDHIEPDWNERPYFTKVENKRGRTGCHIDLSTSKESGLQTSFTPPFESDHFSATPTPNCYHSELFKQYAASIRSLGNRVVLSGIGGDDVMGGGVPTPTPEFQDLLARARFVTLARQLKAWAAKMRKPRLPLLWKAARGFVTTSPPSECEPEPPAPWFDSGFVRRNQVALGRYPSRVKLFGPLPSFQDHLGTLELVRNLLADSPLHSELLREVRFPYLDRDLLEFMYAIPRTQIVRVGQRRSLLKRALVGIVPSELLNRRRKPFVPQQRNRGNSIEWFGLAEIGRRLISNSIGIVDPDRFWEALQKARCNKDISAYSLARTLTFESWLRHLTIHRVLQNSMSPEKEDYPSSLDTKELHRSANPQSSAS